MSKPKRTVSRARAEYATTNVAAARIIASDPARYPESSLPAMWARLTLEKHGVSELAAHPVVEEQRLDVQPSGCATGPAGGLGPQDILRAAESRKNRVAGLPCRAGPSYAGGRWWVN